MMMTTILLAAAVASPIDFTASGMRHVTIDDTPPTTYRNEDGELVAEVKKSASFVLLPFDAPTSVRRLTFIWKAGGLPPTTADSEKTKGGDDFPLRVGLIVAGKAPLIPFFAPSWVKAIATNLKHPSDRLIYFAAGAKSAPGARWESPYSGSIEMVAVGGTRGTDGYETVTATLPSPLNVVGLWIMADGDQTEATFVTRIRSITLE